MAKNTRTKKQNNGNDEKEVNRTLITTGVTIVALLALLFYHRGMGNSGSIMSTRSAMAILSVLLCIYTAVSSAWVILAKKDPILLEYPLFALIFAFGTYCIRGVWFVNSRYALYGMVLICVIYLVVSLLVHWSRMRKGTRRGA